MVPRLIRGIGKKLYQQDLLLIANAALLGLELQTLVILGSNIMGETQPHLSGLTLNDRK